MTEPIIRPMPPSQGAGFFSPTGPLPAELVQGYRHEVVGRFNNYHCTPKKWAWPAKEQKMPSTKIVIDAFAPNLNKLLHAGHLRQLALANSLSRILPQTTSRFVGLFGAQIGVKKASLDALHEWMGFVGYKPEMFYDVLMPQDVVSMREATEEDGSKYEYIKIMNGKYPYVWDGPKGPVIVKTSDGSLLYAHHDLAFVHEVNPTHYITDHGQREHFARLGLENKHLPMGLVLGKTGDTWVKLKSRTGDAMTADEIMDEVISKLKETESPRQLAWNVLAWNFLHISRSNDVKFEVEKWTDPDSAGMYITYTWARIDRALGGSSRSMRNLWMARQEAMGKSFEYSAADVELLALADQYHYWVDQAKKNFDTAALANYAHDLARKLGNLYHLERIMDGRPAYRMALTYANTALEGVMYWLGMFPLSNV